jgi:hypothetical protein
MKISTSYISYEKRLLKGLGLFFLIAVFLFIYFVLQNKQLSFHIILIPAAIIVIAYLRYKHWYRYYITNFRRDEDSVYFEIYDKNQKNEYTFRKDETDIKIDRTFSYGSFHKLIIYTKGERKFYQYQIGGWNKAKIFHLYEALK